MIPNINPIPKEKAKTNIFASIAGVLLILSSIGFIAFGTFNLFRALFTNYNVHTLDLMYFTAGILILFSVTMINLLTEVRDQNKTIGKGVLHLLKNKISPSPKPAGNFSDIINSLFGKQSGEDGENISGSISMYDMSDPDNPIFKGDFNNAEEMNDIRKNLVDKMLNSHKEFKGKKMTKQEMLNELSLRELKVELKMAVEAEDWLWAASLRDKIAEKETNKKGSSNGSEKKDNPEL